MDRFETIIQAYSAKYHRLPEKLSDVLVMKEYDEKAVDGWGKPLIYARQTDNSVILRSVGTTGGEGARSMRFSIIDPNDEQEEDARLDTLVYMENIEALVHHYVFEHQRIPQKLSDLPSPEESSIGYSINDGWG